MIEMEDPIALFDEARKLEAAAVEDDARFQRLTRKLFTTQTGRDWLRLALARSNFMGSVFDGKFSARRAAYQDGIRSVYSEILNAAAPGIRQPAADEDDE